MEVLVVCQLELSSDEHPAACELCHNQRAQVTSDRRAPVPAMQSRFVIPSIRHNFLLLPRPSNPRG